MSSRTAASSNPILTNFAQGLSQDIGSALAEFIAPTVVVGATTGHFKKFDDKNPFQVFNTARAVGGNARRIEFDATDPLYNCKPQALEIPIDDSEREAESGTPLALEQAKTRTLVTSAVLSHENAVLTAIKAGVAAVADRGNFSVQTIDPIDQIDEQIEAISNASGMMPNRIVFGIGAWRLLRQNAKVKARVSGIAMQMGLQAFAGTLLNPSIEPRVGVLVKDAYQFPKTKSGTNIVGDEVFIFYASPSPSVYDPSFAKTFRGSQGSIDSVRVYRDDGARSDVLAVDWSSDIQVVATSCVRRLTIT